eukprot:TRINITY_DN67989_c1_g1_i1.p1 TRINITY_DN67989_c1_g1~~TRINITY_DN67989_c1_g1_i1.p1  ORF type:complete len:793 (+),score=133.31 TRINITY_DN67989_c1_g1_i1:372-2750(+)
MEGNYDPDQVKLSERAGVTPRAVQQIFQSLSKAKCDYTVKLSVLEIYQERLKDLLCPQGESQGELTIYEDKQKGVWVNNLEEVRVHDANELLTSLTKATSKRINAATDSNPDSSRSHMITTITVHVRETTDTGEDFWKIGKLNLVDLAGSENIRRSGAGGVRQEEAGKINQSLLSLAKVITSLVGGDSHIPYRESKLTRLLSDALGGKTKTCVIATISPASENFEETSSTLEYANRAKSIKNRPEVNAKLSKRGKLTALNDENEELRKLLEASREKNGVFLPHDMYDAQQKERETLKNTIAELTSQLQDQETTINSLLQTNQTYAATLAYCKNRYKKIYSLAGKQAEAMKSHAATHKAALQTGYQQVEEFSATTTQLTHQLLSDITVSMKQFIDAHDAEVDNREAACDQFLTKITKQISDVQTNSGELFSEFQQKAKTMKAAVAEETTQLHTIVDDISHQLDEEQNHLDETVERLRSRLCDEMQPAHLSTLRAQTDCAERMNADLARAADVNKQQLAATVEGLNKGIQQLTAQFASYANQVNNCSTEYKNATATRMNQGIQLIDSQYSDMAEMLRESKEYMHTTKTNQRSTVGKAHAGVKRSIHQCNADLDGLNDFVNTGTTAIKNELAGAQSTAEQEHAKSAGSQRLLKEVTGQITTELPKVVMDTASWREIHTAQEAKPPELISQFGQAGSDMDTVAEKIGAVSLKLSADACRYINAVDQVLVDGNNSMPTTPVAKRQCTRSLAEVVQADCQASPAHTPSRTLKELFSPAPGTPAATQQPWFQTPSRSCV